MLRVAIIGVSGMLGSTLLRSLSQKENLMLIGTSRRDKLKIHKKINYIHLQGMNLESEKDFFEALKLEKPNVIINCAGIIKQKNYSEDHLKTLQINSLFPHELNKFCKKEKIRLIQISTDCVFSGAKGNYNEEDISDAKDLYGKSKYLGEINDDHALTIRTSIIGHEVNSNHSLLEWFLSQNDEIEGFTQAIFSGLTTLELSEVIYRILKDFTNLCGIYHISSTPISKYDLLNLVKKIYKKDIKINSSKKIKIDRSLNSKKFQKKTGIKVSDWETMIKSMKKFG
tara:strand:+ start:10352 stop:11203 length:852 start_codon:yes stop_codon:yes gene_type:complete